MKIVKVDDQTIAFCRAAERRFEKNGLTAEWWRVHSSKIDKAILARSTGKGVIEAGKVVYLINGHNRDIWPDGKTKLSIHEYVGLVQDTGWQPLVQLGRDVEMEESN